jgi:CheY-like chemotaxis protein
MQRNPENPVLILIVDDHAMSRTILRDWIEFIYPTCQVLEAENGKTGLEVALTRQPHLILLDLRMPVMSGYEMALALQELTTTRRIPLILCTCEEPNDPHIVALRKICQAVVNKPFHLKTLEYVIKQAVDAHLPPPLVESTLGGIEQAVAYVER